MASNKRVPVKWIRDRAKAAYAKDTKCFICEADTDLDLHHLHSISVLLENWCKKKGIELNTDEDVIAIRDEFIAEHHTEIYDKVYTLCNTHHIMLHKVYGKSPANHTADKQEKWITIQRDKLLGTYVAPESPFSKFL